MTESGADIVARLEHLANKMFQFGNWGADLDTVKAAMDTIVDQRVDLHRATEEAAETADRIEELEAKLAKAVREAFYEGFCEGRDGGWVWGDPTPAWKKSEALAGLNTKQRK